MKKLLESLTVNEFFLSLLVIIIMGIVVFYWDAKRLRDKYKKEFEENKKEVDRLLEYETDDREVEYDRK